VDHARLVELLSDPSFYPHHVDEVEIVQTHISSVFLTGERAYKLKKPVNFGFLDFSTVELRERYCRAEVELNSRLAPSVYLEVQPLTATGDRVEIGGGGEVVDWVVVMRQMDQDLLGTRVQERGELGAHHVDALVDLLVPFYERARTGEGVDAYGTAKGFKVNTDENFTQTESFVGELLTRERFDHIRTFTDRFYEVHAERFAERVASGRIRESHGDLHLGNIFFEDPPVIFDGIEFNERFRCGDVAVDLAFLAMDLDFHGRPELARRLVDGYVARSEDTGLVEVLDFYRCYRAYVRGKISAFTASDPGLDGAAARRFRNLARRYFGLAYRYAGGTTRPPLVVLYGLMGSGKTSLAQFLDEDYDWTYISTDAVRKQISGVGENTRMWLPYNEGLYSPQMNLETYAEVCRRAENLLAGGFSVVVDGAFKNPAMRRPVVDLAERSGARLLFVETTCEPEEQRRRLSERQRYETRSDGRVEIMDAQRRDFEPGVDTEGAAFASVATDGPTAVTRQKLLSTLRSSGIIP
jgi:aminoglycoside phosphotransferase family enzyme/predicted kinase